MPAVGRQLMLAVAAQVPAGFGSYREVHLSLGVAGEPEPEHAIGGRVALLHDCPPGPRVAEVLDLDPGFKRKSVERILGGARDNESLRADTEKRGRIAVRPGYPGLRERHVGRVATRGDAALVAGVRAALLAEAPVGHEALGGGQTFRVRGEGERKRRPCRLGREVSPEQPEAALRAAPVTRIAQLVHSRPPNERELAPDYPEGGGNKPCLLVLGDAAIGQGGARGPTELGQPDSRLAVAIAFHYLAHARDAALKVVLEVPAIRAIPVGRPGSVVRMKRYGVRVACEPSVVQHLKEIRVRTFDGAPEDRQVRRDRLDLGV